MSICNCMLSMTEACDTCINNEINIYKLPKELLSIGQTNNRVTKDSYYFEMAQTVSHRSTCLRRKYGAVIVNNDEVIATGYNGAPRGEVNCCDTGICQKDLKNRPHWAGYEDCCSVHAEMNAIISASRKAMIGGKIYLYGYDVATNSALDARPCPICERLIKNAGLTLAERG